MKTSIEKLCSQNHLLIREIDICVVLKETDLFSQNQVKMQNFVHYISVIVHDLTGSKFLFLSASGFQASFEGFL